MQSDQLDEKDIFNVARTIGSPEARTAYLQQVCGDDAALVDRVHALLQGLEKQESFLESPAAELARTTARAPLSEKPGTQVGPYKLLQQIGEGGFGVVYMAEQQKPVRRKVALKIIKPGMETKQVVARFEAERQALALMDHANVAKVLDAGATDSGRPYFVMELVHGLSITEFCDERKLTNDERLELFVDVCRAVQHAHQKGIIHRDLKPSNVMVTLDDDRPLPKVIDFGVSKALSQQLTEKTLFTAFGQMVGTPLYMAPEQTQMSMRDVDTRSDVYSLGVLLYELLTGTTPFDKETLRESGFEEMRRIICEVEPPRPSDRVSTLAAEALSTVSERRGSDPRQLRHVLRGELDWIAMKALEKDRNRRYESASALAADVDRYLHDEPVQACPPSAAYRLRKYARRHKGGLAAGVLVLGFLVVLGSVIGWAVRDREVRQQELARKAEQDVRHAVEEARKIRSELQAVVTRRGGVQELLDQPDRWGSLIRLAQSELKQARQSAARAEGSLSAELTQALHQLDEQLAEDAADRELALGLEQIRLDRATWLEGRFDFRRAAEEYPRAFPELVGGTEDAAVVAARLRSSPISEQLVAALDDWAYVAFLLKNEALAERILAVARQAAPDPGWGDQMRQVQVWRDPEALAKLVEQAPVTRLSPQMLALVGDLLHLNRSSLEEPWLRRAQARYPADFWLNFGLANALNETQPPEASGFYRAALAVRPENTASYNNLGTTLARLNKLDEAIAAFRKAIDIDPNHFQAHISLGALLCDDLQDYENAAGCFRKAIQIDPESAIAYANLGNALRRQNRLDEAIAACRKGIEVDPENAWPYRFLGLALRDQHKLDEAITAFRKAIELDPKVAQAHCNLGTALARQNKLDEAIAAFRTAIELDPELANASYNLGGALLQQNQLDEAIAAYRRTIELDPEYTAAYYYLGKALALQNQVDEAITAFRKAIELDPGLAGAYSNLGNALSDRNDLEEAIAAYRKAIELSPEYAAAYYYLGNALALQNKLDEAIGAFRKAIELDPNRAGAYSSLGGALQRQNKLEEAVAAFRKSTEINPEDAIAHYNLGNALALLNKLEEAVAAYNRAIELDPDFAKAYANLDIVLARQDKRDEAVAVFRRAIELNPESAEAHSRLGIALVRQNKLEEAVAACRKAIELDPESVGAKARLAIVLAKRGWQLANPSDPAARDLSRALELCQESVELDPQSRTAWHRLGWTYYRAGEWPKCIEAIKKAGQLLSQGNGQGDAAEWIVFSLVDAQLAADPDLPQQERMQHQTQARQWYDRADAQISAWWSERPNDDPTVWDFREEAKKLLGIEQ